jgi:hypothetical protein
MSAARHRKKDKLIYMESQLCRISREAKAKTTSLPWSTLCLSTYNGNDGFMIGEF